MSRDPDDHPISEADRRLFRQAVGPVRPVHCDRAPIFHRRPPPRPRSRERDVREVETALAEAPLPPAEEWETGEELLYARPGLQRAVLRKLRRGHYAVTAEYDLHGHRVPEARRALARFLREAVLRGHRCVRIIHGKGHGSRQKVPVLKQHIGGWLRQRDEVLAYASARPADGGTGALYVLLRARRR